MVQEIITYIIIGAVFIFLVRGAIRMFRRPTKSSGCAGCSGCDIRPEGGKGKANC